MEISNQYEGQQSRFLANLRKGIGFGTLLLAERKAKKIIEKSEKVIVQSEVSKIGRPTLLDLQVYNGELSASLEARVVTVFEGEVEIVHQVAARQDRDLGSAGWIINATRSTYTADGSVTCQSYDSHAADEANSLSVHEVNQTLGFVLSRQQ